MYLSGPGSFVLVRHWAMRDQATDTDGRFAGLRIFVSQRYAGHHSS